MWQTEMVKLLRLMIDDLDTAAERYSDNRLQQLILMSAQFVVTDVIFATSYRVDTDELTLSPDPTDYDADTRDNAFMNLTLLKAACTIDTSETRLAAGQGISISEGSSRVSLGGIVAGRLALWKQGFCSLYQQLRDEYLRGMFSNVGAIVLGPYRTGYSSGYPLDGRYR